MKATKSGYGAAGSYFMAVVAPTVQAGATAMGYEWAPAAGPWLLGAGVLFGILGTFFLAKAVGIGERSRRQDKDAVGDPLEVAPSSKAPLVSQTHYGSGNNQNAETINLTES